MGYIVGILLMLLGVAAGLYVGLWICFIGGIVDIIEAIKLIVNVGDVDAWLIGKGIFKMIIASFAGWLSAVLLILPGQAIIARKATKF